LPNTFECAVALSGVITQKTGFVLSKHETAYIALHIGSLLSAHLNARETRLYASYSFPVITIMGNS
jgi:transcriptional antiterminator